MEAEDRWSPSQGVLVNSPLLRLIAIAVLFVLPFSALRSEPSEAKLVERDDADVRLKGFLAPEGVKIEIVADAPTVASDSVLTFGDDGTAYVLEKRTDASGEKAKSKDVVKVLKDVQGKGVYDSASVLFEVEPSAYLLYHDHGLYLGGETLRRYRLGRAGHPAKGELVAKGFGGSSRRRILGLSLGSDGWLYLGVESGDHRVEGTDGSRALVLGTGAIFRCRPDGSRMEVFASGFQRPQGALIFDAFGNGFQSETIESEGDKSRGGRLLHVAEACDFGWRQRMGGRVIRADRFRTALNGELPGKMPPLHGAAPGPSAGSMIYGETRFPAKYRGLLYAAETERNSIRAYRLQSKGASFVVADEFVFLKSKDTHFLPKQLITGPDGAIYIVEQRGRIYRLSWSGTKTEGALPLSPMDRWLKIVRQSDDQLIASLADENALRRAQAQCELTRRGARNRVPLLKLVRDGERPLPARLASLSVLESFWNEDVQKACETVLADGESSLRRAAAELLGRNAARRDMRVHECLLKVLNENDLPLRRAAALAMGRLAAQGAPDVLVNTLAFDGGDDAYLFDGLIRSLERLGRPGIERLLALAESGVKKDTDRVVRVFAALRVRPGFEGLPMLLKYPHLTVTQRAQLIRSCGNYLLDPPVTLDAIVAYLSTPAGQAPEVKQAGADLLAARPDMPAPKKPNP